MLPEIETDINQLIEFWNNKAIPSPPNPLNDILHFESSKNLYLPDDFKTLYQMTNGMPTLYPNYFDKEGFLFYPLEELISPDNEFNLNKSNPDEHCLIFANFMHKSWWYAVKFSKFTHGYEIGIIPSANKFKVITKNLGDFIHLYMEDSPFLYDHN
ncbi:MAG: SMI1/KNR4 family protein [Bacteroidetes bacterium]|nr:SMI1/KNR4 family protein [Bacteroidota bacterium]